MIEIKDVTKYFDSNCAVNHVTLSIPEGVMFGLLGTNGAGKSTLLRMMAGILESDSGTILLDGEPVYENPLCKEKLFYLPDVPYYFPNSSMEDMIRFYRRNYPGMQRDSVSCMAGQLNLDMSMPLRTFSKGMKRQAFLILALCSGTRYLLCDEVFDGLDPVAAEIMKGLFREEMKERRLTVVAASHKLRDLEDLCQHIGIMHKGGMMGDGSLKERAGEVTKFQCVFQAKGNDAVKEGPLERQQFAEFLGDAFELLSYVREGAFTTLVIRGDKESAAKRLKEKHPVFLGEMPMTLEEIFIAEIEEAGYDIRKVLQQMV